MQITGLASEITGLRGNPSQPKVQTIVADGGLCAAGADSVCLGWQLLFAGGCACDCLQDGGSFAGGGSCCLPLALGRLCACVPRCLRACMPVCLRLRALVLMLACMCVHG